MTLQTLQPPSCFFPAAPLLGIAAGDGMEGQLPCHQDEHIQSSLSGFLWRLLLVQKCKCWILRLFQVQGFLLQDHSHCPPASDLQHLQPCGIMVKCLCGFFGPQVQSSHLYLADACLGCADCERLEEELHQREDWSHSVRSLESLCRTLRCWISSQSSWVLRGSHRLPFDAILQYFLLYIYNYICRTIRYVLPSQDVSKRCSTTFCIVLIACDLWTVKAASIQSLCWGMGFL